MNPKSTSEQTTLHNELLSTGGSSLVAVALSNAAMAALGGHYDSNTAPSIADCRCTAKRQGSLDGDSFRKNRFHRVQSCGRQLIQQYPRYGIWPERITVSPRRWGDHMLVLHTLLMRYESLIIVDAIVAITTAIQAVGTVPSAQLLACTHKVQEERGHRLVRFLVYCIYKHCPT